MADEKTEINKMFELIKKNEISLNDEDKIGFPLKKYNENYAGASENIIKKRFINLKEYNNLPKVIIEQNLKAPYLFTDKNLPEKDQNNKISIPKEYLKFETSTGEKQYLAIEFTNMNDINYKPNLDSEHYKCDLISDYFHEIERLKCKVKDNISNWEYFKENKDKIKKEFIGTFQDKSDNINELLFQYREKIWNDTRKIAPECTQFRPTVMVSMIKYLFKDKLKNINVLDFSSGWGDRLIAAMTFAHEELTYTGYDPNSNLVLGYQEMKNFFLQKELEKYKSNFKLIPKPFEIEDSNVKEETIDLVLTSPPYFMFEKYTEEKTQSIFNKADEDQWLKGFMYKSLIKIEKLLKNDGKLVLIINNYGGKHDPTNYVEKIIYFIQNQLTSMKYKGMISYYEDKENITPQPMWIWEKGAGVNTYIYDSKHLKNAVIKYNKNGDMIDKFMKKNSLKYIKEEDTDNLIYDNGFLIYNNSKLTQNWAGKKKINLDFKIGKDIRDILFSITPQKILDYGCGDGTYLNYFQDKYNLSDDKIICVDIEKNYEKNINPIFIKNDSKNQVDLNIDDNSIELAICTQSLHHVTFPENPNNPEEVLKSIIKTLQKKIMVNGYLLIREHDITNDDELSKVILEHLLHSLTEKDLKSKNYNKEQLNKWIDDYNIKNINRGIYFTREYLNNIILSYGFKHIKTETKIEVVKKPKDSKQGGTNWNNNPTKIYNSLYQRVEKQKQKQSKKAPYLIANAGDIIKKEEIDLIYDLDKLKKNLKFKSEKKTTENTLEFLSKKLLRNKIEGHIEPFINTEKYEINNDKIENLKKQIIDNQEYVWGNATSQCKEVWRNYDIYDGRQKDYIKEKGKMKVRPTRAWLKIYEIINNYKLLEDLDIRENTIVHFDNCALPGAFILSMNHYIKTNMGDVNYDWYGSSMLPTSENDYLKDDFGLRYLYPDRWKMGDDNNGDVISRRNQENWKFIFEDNKVDIYTSDGGFDFGESGFQGKEYDHLELNFGQILTGILTLKKGGCMIIKQYTFFEPLNISILAILTNLFEHVYISKPITSRITNTETYIVAKNFIGFNKANENGYIELLLNKIKDLEDDKKNKTIPLIKISALTKDFIENIYNISYDIYKRHIYHIFEKYIIFEKIKSKKNKNTAYINFIKPWRNNILQEWNNFNNIKPINQQDKIEIKEKIDEDILYLQLGDIISIKKNNDRGDEITGIIIFINKEKMVIKNKKEDSEWDIDTFTIDHKNVINVESIHLLNRKKINSFTIQNNLKINTRIKIKFNDVTEKECYGIIAEKENDRIVVDLYPNADDLTDKRKIYIDFKYQGIPKEIKNIVIYKYSYDINKDLDLDNLDIYREKKEKNDEDKFYLLDDMLDKLYEKILLDYGNYSFKNTKNAKLQVRRYNELLIEYPKLSKINNIDNIPLIEEMGGYNDFLNYKTKVKWIIPTVIITKKGGTHGDKNDETIFDMVFEYEDDNDFYKDIEDEEKNMRLPNNTLYKRIDEKYKNYGENQNFDDENNFNIKIGDNVECILNNNMHNHGNFLSTTVINKTSKSGTFKSGDIGLYTLGKSAYVKHKFIKNLDLFCSENRENIENLYINGFITTDYNLYEYSKIYSTNVSILEKSIYSKCNLNHFSIDINSSSENTKNNDYCTDKLFNINETILDDEKHENMFKTYNFYKVKGSVYYESKNEFISELIPNFEESLHLEMNFNKNINDVSTLRLIKKLSSFSINDYNIRENSLKILHDILDKNIIDFNNNLSICNENINKYNIKYTEEQINNSIEASIINKEIYNIDLKKSTNSEVLQFVLNSDDGNLYRIALKYIENNIPLPDGDIKEQYVKTFEDYIKQLEIKRESIDSKNCDLKTIAKHYSNIEELQKDFDNPNIYYDKIYDDTPYFLLNKKNVKSKDEYEEKKRELILILTEDLKKDPEEAIQIAEDILNNKKKIRKGDVCFVIDPTSLIGNKSPIIKIYYIRNEKHQWIKSEVPSDIFECQLKKPNECIIDIKHKCNAVEMNKSYIREKFLEQSLDKYKKYNNKKIKDSETEYLYYHYYNFLNQNIDYKLERIKLINSFKEGQHYKANSKDVYISPYTDLLHLILNKKDLNEKYISILNFKDSYCRNSKENEKQHFYYCKESNKPLLPKFYEKLAKTYLDAFSNYDDVLNTICFNNETGIGIIDGNYIVDKYSGYIIQDREFVEELTYSDNGGVIQRTTLADDIDDFEKLTELEHFINNFILKFNETLQIKEFKIKEMIKIIVELVKNKYDKSLIVVFYTTVAVYLIFCQCFINRNYNIKTFNGCFMINLIKGYPVNDDDDEIGLKTMACFIREYFKTTNYHNLFKKNLMTKEEYLNCLKDAPKGPTKIKKKFINNKLDNVIISKLKPYIELAMENKNIIETITIYKKNKTKDLDQSEDNKDIFLPVQNNYKFSYLTEQINKKNQNKILNNSIYNSLNLDNNSYPNNTKKIYTHLNRLNNSKDIINNEIKFNVLLFQLLINIVLKNEKKIKPHKMEKNNYSLENTTCIDNIYDDNGNIYKAGFNIYEHIIEKYKPSISGGKSLYLLKGKEAGISGLNLKRDFSLYIKKIKLRLQFFEDYINNNLLKETKLITTTNTKRKYDIISIKIDDNTKKKYIEMKIKEDIGELSKDEINQIFQENYNRNVENLKHILNNYEYDGEDGDEEDINYLYNIRRLENEFEHYFRQIDNSIQEEIEEVENTYEKKQNTIFEILLLYLNNPTNDLHVIENYLTGVSSSIEHILKHTYSCDDSILLFLDKIDKFDMFGEETYLERNVETRNYNNNFIKQCCVNMSSSYIEIVKNCDFFQNKNNLKLNPEYDYKDNITYMEHWNLQKTHCNNIDDIVFHELKHLFKDNKMEQLDKIKKKLYIEQNLSNYLDLLYRIIKNIPTLINKKNPYILTKFFKSFLTLIIFVYFKYGFNDNINNCNFLINKYISTLNLTYDVLNISDINLKEYLDKLKEEEKARITEKFKSLKPEERKIESLLMTNKLGHWGLGQQKTLYKYDAANYELEMKEVEIWKLKKKINALKEKLKDNDDKELNIQFKELSEKLKKLQEGSTYLQNKHSEEDNALITSVKERITDMGNFKQKEQDDNSQIDSLIDTHLLSALNVLEEE